MQYLLIVVLAVAMGGSVVSFLVMARRQRRRCGALTRQACQLNLRFSRDDPFGLDALYGRFALIAGGHSPHAHNVAYGRVNGHAVRAFDFHNECGHGISRLARHYSVLVVEMDRDLPSVLMWHEQDVAAAPLALQRHHWRLNSWLCRGDRAVAGALSVIGADTLAPRSMESHGGAVMVWQAVDSKGQAYAGQFIDLARVSDLVVRALSEPATPQQEDSIT
ncbi:MAG: hypothetical protein ABFD92_15535 [Planctomycetaceae bacterium]|nr:hypothetical protein [Planctomycetaceae bacterium]